MSHLSPLPLTFHGDTTAEFQEQLRLGLANFPARLAERLAAHGVRLSGAGIVSDYGINGHDMRDGVYRKGHIVIAERKEVAPGRFRLNADPIGSLYHELGHAVYDKLLAAKQRLNLARVARQDALALPYEHHERMYPFIQSQERQPREMFAEAFAGNLGRNSAGYGDFAERFPHTSTFVARIIQDPEAHGEIVYRPTPE